MEAIKRQIFVLRDTLKDCIDYTLGTDMVPIEYHVMDFAIPATATAVVYVLRPDGDLDKILADVLDNVISFTPTKGFFAEGLNAIQIRIVNNNKALVSFTETVRVGKSMKFDDDAEAQQKTLIEQLLMKIGESDGNMKIERVERIAGDENEKAERNKAIAAEQKEREKEIDVERQRINNLAKLQEGSTTGDAELADVRVGADGKTYENAGEAVRGQVTALKEELDYYKRNIGECENLDGYYLGSGGTYNPHTSWNVKRYIKLKKGEKIVLKTKSANINIVMIAHCITKTTFIPLVLAKNTEFTSYCYVATENMYVGISLNKDIDNEFYILSNARYDNKYETLLSYEKPTLTVDKYVAYENGNINSIPECSCSDYVKVKEKYKIALLNYENFPNKDLRGIAFYDANHTYISGEQLDGTDYISIVPVGAAYMRYSISTEKAESYKLIITPNEYEMDKKKPKPYTSIALFEKIGVIGDSFASGEIYIDGNAKPNGDFYNISWGQILARKNGVSVTNFSCGGLTTRSWLTSQYGLKKLQNESAQDLYLIVLGINDVYSILSENPNYIGKETDINTEADTLWGNMSKIINAIKFKNPKARIIILGLANRYPYSEYWQAKIDMENNGLKAIANYYGVPYKCEADYDYFNSDFYNTNMVGGHPTAINYAGMSEEIKKIVEDAMIENSSYFLTYPVS